MGHLSMGVFDMKKFIINILIFFGIVAVIDVAAGKAFWYLQSNRAGGGTGAEYYVCEKGLEDILIMGSSRASHHYVSHLFQDSLGMSCFNGGQDGNGIVMQYGRWKMISKRHIPKLVIYDIEPSFDLVKDDNTRYIDRLKPYAGDQDVSCYIAGLFPIEGLKLCSQLYRYNYKFLEIVSDCVRPGIVNGGYKPKYGHIREEMIKATPQESSAKGFIYDEMKIEQLRNMITEIQEAGGTFVFVASPYYRSLPQPDLSVVQQLSEEMSVPFFNYCDSEMCDMADYFGDSMHLNDTGANVFTNDVIERIRILGL